MTVALADVDGLHMINANLGHAAGDQYLTVVAPAARHRGTAGRQTRWQSAMLPRRVTPSMRGTHSQGRPAAVTWSGNSV
jgi:hypothetical protein